SATSTTAASPRPGSSRSFRGVLYTPGRAKDSPKRARSEGASCQVAVEDGAVGPADRDRVADADDLGHAVRQTEVEVGDRLAVGADHDGVRADGVELVR